MTKILNNMWYLAAWSEELTDAPLGRRICDIPMVLFRNSTGEVAAMRDRCPHRFAPLSLGKIVPQGLSCPYHGLVFDAAGRCVHNPFGVPPEAAKVETFPLIERDDCLWVWHGDATLADDGKIPDYSSFLYGPEVGATRQRVTMNGQLLIGVENLLDLTHSSFLHVPTIPHWEAFNFSKADFTCGWKRNVLVARWTFKNPFGSEIFWIQSTWTPPGTMTLSSSTDPSGRHRDPPYTQLHLYTPETETTTHYFTADRYHLDIEDIEQAQERAKLLASQVFDEDNAVIARIEQEIGDKNFLEMSPVLLSIDKAAVIARRHFETLLAAQAEQV